MTGFMIGNDFFLLWRKNSTLLSNSWRSQPKNFPLITAKIV